jgi:DNA-binding NarL/FixJ family response regulator
VQHTDGPEELEKAIRQVAASRFYPADVFPSTSALVEFLPINGHGKGERTFSDSSGSPVVAELSRREVEILKMIGQEYSSPEIARHLFISVKTVETHRKNLMKKLGVKSMTGLLRYGLKQGWF